MRSVTVRLLLAGGSALLAILLLEVGLRSVTPGATLLPRAVPRPYDTVPDDQLGYRPRASSRFNAKKSFGGGTCYDVVYTTDAFGRRIVPAAGDATATRPRLILLGCSYTFGEGLRDEETLQYKLGRRFDVINYAVHGHGPQHTLALLRDDRLQHELPRGEALALYIFYPYHLRRAVMTSDTYWLLDGPYFQLAKDGTLRDVSCFSCQQPFRAAIYRALGFFHSRSMLLRRTGLRWPPWPDPSRAELTAAILIESARRFEEYWKGPFVVAIQDERADPDGVRSLLERLRAANVAVLDYSAVHIEPADQVCAPLDSHPNGRFTTRLAEQLERDLMSIARARYRR